MQTQGYKAVIVGGSGATGRVLIRELLNSPKWSEINIITRRTLDEWKGLPEEKQKKIKIIQNDNLDDLEDASKWDFAGKDSFFCCLGTRTKVGKELFIKVDKTYPLWFAKLASHFKVPHLSVLSSVGGDSSSWFLYMKTKGEVEDALKKMDDINHISIFKPGAIMNRENDKRFGESLLKIVPFVSRIESNDVGKCLRMEAELQHA